MYKNTRVQLEKVFCLEHKTTRHSPMKMKITFDKLARYMQEHHTIVGVPGRTTNYSIPDVMEDRMHITVNKSGATGAGEETVQDADIGMGEQMGLLGDEAEVEDDGDLDV